jgi:carbonic anhydrase
MTDMAVDVPRRLLAGYRRFRRDRFPGESERFHRLAAGQSPRIMVIGCADSRVDPATIFSAAPGEIFVVRNVANLVPPPDPSGGCHGTSAALEFAVTQIEVRDILVLGHALCGGIAAALASTEGRPAGEYIAPWVALLDEVRGDVLADESLETQVARQQALELDAIRHSLANLRRFTFVREALDGGGLMLHGAWFSIAEGTLHWLDGEDDQFVPVDRLSHTGEHEHMC